MGMIEGLFYEARPYLYLALGVYVLSSQEPSSFLITCTLVLMFAAALIIRFRMKARRGSGFEQLFYDCQPFVYLGLGAYALVFLRYSKFALACALLLLFSGTMIVRWRMRGHR